MAIKRRVDTCVSRCMTNVLLRRSIVRHFYVTAVVVIVAVLLVDRVIVTKVLYQSARHAPRPSDSFRSYFTEDFGCFLQYRNSLSQ
jgi:hypothetical protein